MYSVETADNRGRSNFSKILHFAITRSSLILFTKEDKQLFLSAFWFCASHNTLKFRLLRNNLLEASCLVFISQPWLLISLAKVNFLENQQTDCVEQPLFTMVFLAKIVWTLGNTHWVYQEIVLERHHLKLQRFTLYKSHSQLPDPETCLLPKPCLVSLLS